MKNKQKQENSKVQLLHEVKCKPEPMLTAWQGGPMSSLARVQSGST